MAKEKPVSKSKLVKVRLNERRGFRVDGEIIYVNKGETYEIPKDSVAMYVKHGVATKV